MEDMLDGDMILGTNKWYGTHASNWNLSFIGKADISFVKWGVFGEAPTPRDHVHGSSTVEDKVEEGS